VLAEILCFIHTHAKSKHLKIVIWNCEEACKHEELFAPVTQACLHFNSNALELTTISNKNHEVCSAIG